MGEVVKSQTVHQWGSGSMITPSGHIRIRWDNSIRADIYDPAWVGFSLPGETRQLLAGMIVHLYPAPPEDHDDDDPTPTGQLIPTRDDSRGISMADLVAVRIYDDPPGRCYVAPTAWIRQATDGERDRVPLIVAPPGVGP